MCYCFCELKTAMAASTALLFVCYRKNLIDFSSSSLQCFSLYFFRFLFDLKASLEKEQFSATKTIVILFSLQGVMIFCSAFVSFISMAFHKRIHLIIVSKFTLEKNEILFIVSLYHSFCPPVQRVFRFQCRVNICSTN